MMGDTFVGADAVKKGLRFVWLTVAKQAMPNTGRVTTIIEAKESRIEY